jgi:hypothetical protein
VETEALLEVRGKKAARMYDICIKELGRGLSLEWTTSLRKKEEKPHL